MAFRLGSPAAAPNSGDHQRRATGRCRRPLPVGVYVSVARHPPSSQLEMTATAAGQRRHLQRAGTVATIAVRHPAGTFTDMGSAKGRSDGKIAYTSTDPEQYIPTAKAPRRIVLAPAGGRTRPTPHRRSGLAIPTIDRTVTMSRASSALRRLGSSTTRRQGCRSRSSERRSSRDGRPRWQNDRPRHYPKTLDHRHLTALTTAAVCSHTQRYTVTATALNWNIGNICL